MKSILLIPLILLTVKVTGCSQVLINNELAYEDWQKADPNGNTSTVVADNGISQLNMIIKKEVSLDCRMVLNQFSTLLFHNSYSPEIIDAKSRSFVLVDVGSRTFQLKAKKLESLKLVSGDYNNQIQDNYQRFNNH